MSHRALTARRLSLISPPAFVLTWATGFVVARLVAPHTEPLTFLVLRFLGASAILATAAAAFGAAWPRTPRQWRDALVAGMLLHGVYLSSVFWAIKHGLPAGVAALIAGLQPLMTAILAGPVLGEIVTPRRWLGIGLGFAGAILVLGGKLDGGAAYPVSALISCCAGALALTVGTLWQKRSGSPLDLRTGTAVQYLGALVVTLPLALLTETGQIDPVPAFWIGLAWAVLVLSIGAVFLLLAMIRRGAVAGIASLMYLVPPVAALLGYAIFGETLGWVQIAGIVVATVGVAIANRG